LQSEIYTADSGRGQGTEKVVVILLSRPEDLLATQKNLVLRGLDEAGVSNSVGLYFYRFADSQLPFMKIGECGRSEGVALRFKRGWHYSTTCADTYRGARKKDGAENPSQFLTTVKTISEETPAYFVFYEMRATHSFPKIDEMHAYRNHINHFGRGTTNVERINTHETLGVELIFHKRAFSEVLEKKLPSGLAYER